MSLVIAFGFQSSVQIRCSGPCSCKSSLRTLRKQAAAYEACSIHRTILFSLSPQEPQKPRAATEYLRTLIPACLNSIYFRSYLSCLCFLTNSTRQSPCPPLSLSAPLPRRIPYSLFSIDQSTNNRIRGGKPRAEQHRYQSGRSWRSHQHRLASASAHSKSPEPCGQVERSIGLWTEKACW